MTEESNTPAAVPSMDDTRALAMAASTLVFALITHLSKRGIIPTPDAVDLFQAALEVLETIPPASDPGVDKARQLIDGFAQIVATHGTLAPKADQT
jgi:hypothetical protein